MHSILRVAIYVLALSFIACSTTYAWADPEWITSKEGVKLWNPSPQANESCSWTGKKSRRGYASGRGLVVWYVDGQVTQVSQVTYSFGRPVGTTIALEASGEISAWSDKGEQHDVKVVPRITEEEEPQQVTAFRPTQSETTNVPPAAASTATEMQETIETIKSGVELINEIAKTNATKVSADILVKSVRVAATKEGGQAWDASGGSPELKVQISKGLFGSKTTTAGSNSTSASFNEKLIRVSEGDTITITVYDQDAFADDFVGSYEKQISADTIKQGTVTWSFDQVTELVLEFQP
jgi:hypothetical protein